MQLPAPAFMIKLAMGEMGKELLLSGQKVLPSKLIKEGFVFKYNLVEKAIEI
jgi:NAD dependent epimerase/dehydratase family enzyme